MKPCLTIRDSSVWKQVFLATWKGFTLKLNGIKENMARHRRLIESRASLMQYEEVRKIRQQEEEETERTRQTDKRRRHQEVMQWLSPFIPDDLQESYRAIRAICPDAGRWILETPKVQDWLSPRYCSTPLLWLNGIPGAGEHLLFPTLVVFLFDTFLYCFPFHISQTVCKLKV
jgi:hypothetical protein